MLLMANAGVVSVTAGTAPETSARQVGHRLQAFAGPGAAPLPPPPTPRRMLRALLRADRAGKA